MSAPESHPAESILRKLLSDEHEFPNWGGGYLSGSTLHADVRLDLTQEEADYLRSLEQGERCYHPLSERRSDGRIESCGRCGTRLVRIV